MLCEVSIQFLARDLGDLRVWEGLKSPIIPIMNLEVTIATTIAITFISL
jgi:hypothetical protein